jgi:hypothetical protein
MRSKAPCDFGGFGGTHLECSAKKNGRRIMKHRLLEMLREEEKKHNTAAALRVKHISCEVGLPKKPETPEDLTAKTAKTTNTPKIEGENQQTRQTQAAKTAKTTEAEELGLVATWSSHFGFLSIHDPATGEWHDLHWKDAPEWARWEAKKRKELYREGDRRAPRLTSREIAEIWASENQPSNEEGIVEEHPVEDES